ncbi:MAG: OsmC family protein [Paracoccaceae bacterium]
MKIATTVAWAGQTTPEGRYSRVHRWHFDGGATVAASSAPGIVPEPYSDPSCVDPEEVVLAALSSCHMLFFLHLAGAAGWIATQYSDRAEAALVPDDLGRLHIGNIRLSPEVTFAAPPPEAELHRLHDEAHARCFIAASLKAPVTVVPRIAEDVFGCRTDGHL